MDYELARAHMVNHQVRTNDVIDDAVLDVMNTISRDVFVPEQWREAAYADAGVPIGEGERMFSPRLDGRILQAVEIRPGERALEIGTGSGYLAACMARLGASVVALERKEALAEAARGHLAAAHIEGVEVRHAEAPAGLPAERFDVIVVGGAIAQGVEAFQQKLAPEGRLFVVEGQAPAMSARLIRRASEDRWYAEDLFETVLPHLVGYEPRPGFRF